MEPISCNLSKTGIGGGGGGNLMKGCDKSPNFLAVLAVLCKGRRHQGEDNEVDILFSLLESYLILDNHSEKKSIFPDKIIYIYLLFIPTNRQSIHTCYGAYLTLLLLLLLLL